MFKKGQSGNPAGRPIGSRNKLTDEFITDVYDLWQTKGKDAVIQMQEEDNTQFVRMVASLLPKDHNFKMDDFDDLPIDELIRRANTLATSLGILGTAERDQEKAGSKQAH
jgi:hypothetical protein